MWGSSAFRDLGHLSIQQGYPVQFLIETNLLPIPLVSRNNSGDVTTIILYKPKANLTRVSEKLHDILIHTVMPLHNVAGVGGLCLGVEAK